MTTLGIIDVSIMAFILKVKIAVMKTFHEFHNALEELLYRAANGEHVSEEAQKVVSEVETSEQLSEIDKQILRTLWHRIKQWNSKA